TLHRFDDVGVVLREIRRVLKTKGALLVRDFRRPGRWEISRRIQQHSARHGCAMRPQLEAAVRAAYTRSELMSAVRESGLSGAQMIETDPAYMMIERHGETDPGSWIVAREQYR